MLGLDWSTDVTSRKNPAADAKWNGNWDKY